MSEGEKKYINPPNKRDRPGFDNLQWLEDTVRDNTDIWQDLKKRTPNWEGLMQKEAQFRPNPEHVLEKNGSFEEIRKLIPKEQWLYLVDELKRIDLNSEETVDIDGRQYNNEEPEAVYIDLAADLKEFDEEGFGKSVVDKEQKWLELKGFLENRRGGIDDFLHYAYNLKILYPEKFINGEFNFDGKILWQVISKLETLSAEQNWGEFLNVFRKAFYLFGDRIEESFPLNSGTKKEVVSWVKTFKGKDPLYLYARATILSQECLQDKLWNISLTKAEWALVKKEIVADLNGRMRIWDVIRKVRILKGVQVR